MRSVQAFLYSFLIGLLMTYCTSSYKTPSATLPSKQHKENEGKDRKELKGHLKKQGKKVEEVKKLQNMDRSPSENVNLDKKNKKRKKKKVRTPETYY